MRTNISSPMWPVACLGVLSPLGLTGCGNFITPAQNGDTRASLNSVVVVNSDPLPDDVDPSNVFRQMAETMVLEDSPWRIQGVLTSPDDIDLFKIGPVEAGDRIVVTLEQQPPLNAAIALFDANGSSLLINDHRNVYLGQTQPFIDVIFPDAQPTSYVAVSVTPGFGESGSYALEATKQTGFVLPELRPDVAILDFSGSNGVRISSRAPVDMSPFDAATIAPAYSGLTDQMIDVIVDRVRDDYEAFDVTILSTSEGDRYEPGMTRIFFGSYDAGLLGVAEGVDEFNATSDQQAIVFTDSFVAFTPLDPTIEQMGQAIANVASHEIGHLMGMVHTDDPYGIMDVTASLDDLLQDQSFRKSKLYSSVFPVGFQDAPYYLLNAVGGDAELVKAKAERDERRKTTRYRDSRRPPAREVLHLSRCALER